MSDELVDLSEDETQSLPIDRLALLVLRHLVDSNQSHQHNFLNSGANRGISEKTLRCWSEALNWLISSNLVARGLPRVSDSQAIFVTRLGRRVLSEGYDGIRAIQRLNIDLHERLARARSQFLNGEFEIAAFAAMREVEIRVRELSGTDTSHVGVKLMREAFGKNGALADPELDPGEQVGVMELFAGAIGTFKNPPSHRQVDYANPTEASEVVLLADLLMRLLDRTGASRS
jgi:uncharacterized protein (TIGR02391 family)